MKKILLCSQRNKFFKYLQIASEGFKKFGSFEVECRNLEESLIKEYDKYNLIIMAFWYLDEIGRQLWPKLSKENFPVIFWSDGCFSHHLKKSQSFKDYPIATFLGGPQSSSFGKKFFREDLPSDRLHLFESEIKASPWRSKGDHIIITHQRGKTYDMEDKQPIYDLILEKCISSGRPILYRLHPNSNYKPLIESGWMNKISQSLNKASKGSKIVKSTNRSSFLTDLKNAHCTIMYGGKASVISALKGVPCITYTTTMAEMVAEKNSDNIESPKMPDRESWRRWLSYSHFTVNEMEKGIPWKFFMDQGYLKI